VIIVLGYVIPRYGAFQIRPLLASIHGLFDALHKLNRETFIATIVKELDTSVGRVVIKANATANYFTLLNWVNQSIQLASADQPTLEKYLPDLIQWQAILLQLCLSEGKKKGLKTAAIGITRACLRKLFQQRDSNLSANAVQTYIKTLTSSKTSPVAAAVALGIVAGVSCRLRSTVSSEMVESSKIVFYDFFVKEIVGSKVRIPNFAMVHWVCLWILIKE